MDFSETETNPTENMLDVNEQNDPVGDRKKKKKKEKNFRRLVNCKTDQAPRRWTVGCQSQSRYKCDKEI